MEVYKCCDVLLPRLHVVRIHRNLLGLVGVLVGQTCKTVAKLVHHHLAILRMVGHREVVRVEYSATAILACVYKHYDVLVGHASQHVVQRLKVERCEVAVGIECVEMASQYRISPHALRRLTCSAVYRWRLYSHDIKSVAHGAEWLVLEQGLCGNLGILHKCCHLAWLVALGHIGYVDTFGCVLSLLQSNVWRGVAKSDVPYQHVLWRHGMG